MPCYTILHTIFPTFFFESKDVFILRSCLKYHGSQCHESHHKTCQNLICTDVLSLLHQHEDIFIHFCKYCLLWKAHALYSCCCQEQTLCTAKPCKGRVQSTPLSPPTPHTQIILFFCCLHISFQLWLSWAYIFK